MVSGRRQKSAARLVVGAAVVALAGIWSALPAGSEGRSGRRTTYIVQLATAPLAASDGPIRALEAERVGRFNALAERSERRALSSARAGGAPVLHRYRNAF